MGVHTIDIASEIDEAPLTLPTSAHSVFHSVSALRTPNRNPRNPTLLSTFIIHTHPHIHMLNDRHKNMLIDFVLLKTMYLKSKPLS